MARLRSLAPLALCLALVLAAPAQARTVLGDLPGTTADYDEHSVTRGALVYGHDGYSEPYGIFIRRGDRDVRRLRQFDSLGSLRARHPYADERRRGVSVGASDRLVAVAVATRSLHYDGNEEHAEPAPAAVAVAPPGARRAVRIASCRAATLESVRVDGRTVAYLGAGCDDDRTGIGVRDMTSGAARTIRPPAGSRFYELRLAGRYVAALVEGRRDGIVVYDWRSGRQLHRVPALGVDFALQRDGTLAYPDVGDACEGGEIRWTSREGRRHVPRDPICADGILLASDRILAIADQPPGEDPRTQVMLTDLDGGNRTPLFESSVPGWSLRFPLLFDGTRIGYATPNCEAGERIVVDTVAELAASGPIAHERCTVSMSRIASRATVGSRGGFRLVLACRNGCIGRIRLWDPAGQRHLAFYGLGEAASVRAPRSRATRHEFTLERDEAERLRRAGRLELELRVEVQQLGAPSTTRSKPLTLVAGS
jgi:hypothetical protein